MKSRSTSASPSTRGDFLGGSVLLEFVLAFPVILTLVLGCMQVAHIWVVRQVVLYSAYCAARAALVCHRSEYQAAAQQAAEQVCAWVVIGQAADEREKAIPGWGRIPGSGAVGRKTRGILASDVGWNVEVTVQFDLALVMPIAGPAIGWLVNPWDRGAEWTEQRSDPTGNRHRRRDTVGYPHIMLEETVRLPKPYVTLPMMGIPSGGW